MGRKIEKVKAIPFMVKTGIDFSVHMGGYVETDQGKLVVSSIRSVKFVAGRLEVIGMGRPKAGKKFCEDIEEKTMCDECDGQGMVITDISKGTIRPCPVCKGKGEVNE
jgi:hypothetical protein